jgi:hypothetical protein
MAGDSRSIDLQRILQINFRGEKFECANFLTRMEEQATKCTKFSPSRNLFFDAFNRYEACSEDRKRFFRMIQKCRRKMSAVKMSARNVGGAGIFE